MEGGDTSYLREKNGNKRTKTAVQWIGGEMDIDMDHWKQIIIIGTEGTNKKQCKIGHRSIWSPQGVQRENVTLLIRLLHIRISPSGISTRRLI